MIVAIWAFENTYGGLHGIESHLVINVADIKEAEEIAADESREVIENHCMDEMRGYADAEVEAGEMEEDSDEYNDYVNECIEDDIGYQIWEIVDCYDTIEQMQEDFYNCREEFVKEHCREIE